MYQPQDIAPKTIIGWAEGALVERSKPTQYRQTPEPVDYFLEKGGWETVLKLWLSSKFRELPGNPTVECEQAIYQDPRQDVDILIRPALGKVICIELKAESLFHSALQGRQTVPHKFFDEVADDIVKLHSVKQQYADAIKMVVAVCFSVEAAQSMRNRDFEEDTITLGEEKDSWPVTIFWRVI
ncbi:hypothetical protein [Burkholderia sp. Bp8998]|uniref:hypothetical protein n=1 Tax=Burkholderia sp. Bp8998 TaxID=2184557 RepID=UPI000F5A0481|nr:hypothetical protein [Burkholderia sp. Bp8998]RQS17877.1 hypothetical protein DIE06_16005 [Burkholderia sp. Bp8998]